MAAMTKTQTFLPSSDIAGPAGRRAGTGLLLRRPAKTAPVPAGCQSSG
jgi:hypothetical protein